MNMETNNNNNNNNNNRMKEYNADTEEEECGGGGESSSSAEKNKKKKKGAVAAVSCQAEKCGADLSDAKRYHRRHRVCDIHSKAPFVPVAGLRQRFCQQCSRFHEISEFDDAKRSCRRRLAGHNERRRKSSVECYGEASAPKINIITPKETHHYNNNGDHGNDQRPKFQMTPHQGNTSQYNNYYMK